MDVSAPHPRLPGGTCETEDAAQLNGPNPGLILGRIFFALNRRRRKRSAHGKRLVPVLVLLAVTCGYVPAVPRQCVAAASTRAVPGRAGSAFSNIVPPDVSLFASVRRIGDADAALQRARAWSLIPLLSGSPLGVDRDFDLAGAVAGLFAIDAGKHRADIAAMEFGVMADSWKKLADAVWLLRLPDESVLEEWYPVESRVQSGRSGRAAFFRLPTGQMIVVRNGVVALGKAWGPGSLLDKTMALMAGPGGRALEHDPDFRAVRRHLPVDQVAMVYMGRKQNAPADAFVSWPMMPRFERGIIGLYESRGRLDVVVQAHLAEENPRARLGRSAIERLLQLPQTTLLATATTLDVREAVRSTAKGVPGGSWMRYVSMLAAFATATEATSSVDLGPHVLLAWGQDLSSAGKTPQLALLSECDEQQGEVRDHVRGVAERVVGLIGGLGAGDADHLPQIEETRHLGVAIGYLSFAEFARASRVPLLTMLEHIEPAWALHDGWLIVALTRDHLQQILEARMGLLPTLGTVPDAAGLQREAAARSVVSLVQPGLATTVLEGWLAAHDSGESSLLDVEQLSKGDPVRRPPRALLGIGMKMRQESGAVFVARVYRKTPAKRRLQVGDRILGIDGSLLAFDSPNSDLRRRWATATPGNTRTLRILRDEKIIEVDLPNEPKPINKPAQTVNPVDAVRELVSLGRTLEFVSFVVNASSGRDYSARLSLRFTARRVTDGGDNP